MTHSEIEDLLLNKPEASKSFPFDKTTAVYKVGDKMFALIDTTKDPLRISLKCDPGLAESLRERFESVMPGHHLNKRHWNTIVLSGQVDDEMLVDLVNHSYNLVAEKITH